MPSWPGRRARGTPVVFVAVPAPVEVVTGRLIEAADDEVTIEDDAGVARSLERLRTFRATPDHLARLRSLQVTEQLLREQLDALLTEMERI